MKYHPGPQVDGWQTSRPTRGAWIEITDINVAPPQGAASRPTRGAWIEMRVRSSVDRTQSRRAPHGARGLKSPSNIMRDVPIKVAPHTGRVD